MASPNITIRELKPTLDDAEKLAQLLNTWDNDTSWPGGFSGGLTFTGEYILREWLKNIQVFKDYVAVQGEEFVGYVSLDYHFYDSEGMYIPLLGVNPAYQGKGIGKALLLHAIKQATELGYRRIDLHTWAGNNRAMPLYKRVGFFWYPKTVVLMVNFIPGILNTPYFRDIIGEDWYHSIKPHITQEEDNTQYHGIDAFLYHFNHDAGQLDIYYDRVSFDLMGFTHHLASGDLMVEFYTTPQYMFLGFDTPTLILHVNNTTEEPVTLTGDLIFNTQYIEFLDPVSSIQEIIPPHTEKTITLPYKITIEPTAPVDDDPSHHPLSKIILKAKINEKDIQFASWPRILEPFEVAADPTYVLRAAQTGFKTTITVKNLLPRAFQGKIQVNVKNNLLTQIEATINPGKSYSLDVSVPNDLVSHPMTELSLSFLNAKATYQSPLIIGTPRKNEPVAYLVSPEYYILENSTLRVFGSRKKRSRIKELLHKPTGTTIENLFFMDIGLPWQETRSDFESFEPEVSLDVNEIEAAIHLSILSKRDKPGLRVTQTFRLSPEQAILYLTYQFLNEHDQRIENIAFRVSGGWRSFIKSSTVYLSREQGILVTSDESFKDGFMKDQDDRVPYEGWTALESPSESGLGMIFNQREFKQIRAKTGGVAYLESLPFQLDPHASKEFDPIEYHFGSINYATIRGQWALTYGEYPPSPLPLREPVNMQVISSISDDLPFTEAQDTIPIRITNFTGLPLDHVKLKLSNTITTHTLPKFSMITIPVPQTLFENEVATLDMKLRNSWRSHHLVQLPWKNTQTTVRKEQKHNTECTIITTPHWELTFSPLNKNIISARISNEELLFSRFPKTDPYVYFQFFPGGLTPNIFLKHQKQELIFSSLPAEQTFIAEHDTHVEISFSGTNQDLPILQGLHYKITYLVYKGYPAVEAKITITNNTKAQQIINAGFIVSLNHNLKTIWSSPKNKELYIGYPVAGNNITVSKAETKWAGVIPKQSPGVFGVLDKTLDSDLLLFVIKDLLTTSFNQKQFTLKPGEHGTYRLFLLKTTHLEALRYLSEL